MENAIPYFVGFVALAGLFLLLRKAYKYADHQVGTTESGCTTEPLVADYLRKITMLEKQIGDKVGYKQLKPFWVPGTHFGDVIRLQGAARKIAEHVGLDNFTFVISIAKQKENVAGHIELNYSGNDVFIEMSHEMVNFEDGVVATLAHEIAHKYMQIHSITTGVGLAHKFENEVLTDITAVFLGLGKFMLNGAEEEKTHQEEKFDGTNYITRTQKCGYLSRWQLAFVYRLICAMRGISRQDMLSDLSPAAKSAVTFCENDYREYFDSKFQTDDFREQALAIATKDIEKARAELCRANERLEIVQEACVDRVKAVLQVKHDRITSLKNDLESLTHDEIYDPCLRFLNSIHLEKRARQIQSEARQQNVGISKLSNRLKKLNTKIQKFKLDDVGMKD